MSLPERSSAAAARSSCAAGSRRAGSASRFAPTAQCAPCRDLRCSASKRLPAASPAHKKHGARPSLRAHADEAMTEASALSTAGPAVSVIVPVRNEADNIAPLVDEISAALTGRWTFEVIYVNDGSTDGTEAVLSRLASEKPWLRQIKHTLSCGQSAAIRTGVAAARADMIATL